MDRFKHVTKGPWEKKKKKFCMVTFIFYGGNLFGFLSRKIRVNIKHWSTISWHVGFRVSSMSLFIESFSDVVALIFYDLV